MAEQSPDGFIQELPAAVRSLHDRLLDLRREVPDAPRVTVGEDRGVLLMTNYGIAVLLLDGTDPTQECVLYHPQRQMRARLDETGAADLTDNLSKRPLFPPGEYVDEQARW